MTEQDIRDLQRALQMLENPSVGAQVANAIGTPVEKAIAMLPAKATEIISSATHKAIFAALKVSLKTMEGNAIPTADSQPKSNWWHMAAAATSGAIGGAFGLTTFAIELPVSTVIMLRSIADVARSQGANLNDLQTQLECVQVLALGGHTRADDASGVGYFVTREALVRAVSEAAVHLARNGLQKESAPAIVRLVTMIAERFSINITEKAAAQLLPVIGAAAGAAINTIFIDHFQKMAWGHFTVRRLEEKYGAQVVRAKYSELAPAQS